MMRKIHLNTALFLAALLLCAACSGSRGATNGEGPDPDPNAIETINMADYEDFDPTPYEEEPPTSTTTIAHDVPERLLKGQVEQQVSQTGPGYRIQVYSSQDKRNADRRVESAVAWWRRQLRLGTLAEVYRGDPEPPPVYLDFRQPYYRVRVGNFGTRSEARSFLQLIETQFPDAFIAPDTVTLTR